MIDVYKLDAGGKIATLVGHVRNDREIGDKLRLKSCLYQLHVIGKTPPTGRGNAAIYCVYKEELGRVTSK